MFSVQAHASLGHVLVLFVTLPRPLVIPVLSLLSSQFHMSSYSVPLYNPVPVHCETFCDPL